MKGTKTIEYVKDDLVQLAYSVRLASVRAKGMAIIISEIGEYAGIDEVHVVIGPKVDVKIKMIEDADGIVDEQVFAEDYIQHVPGKYGVKGDVMYITVPLALSLQN